MISGPFPDQASAERDSMRDVAIQRGDIPAATRGPVKVYLGWDPREQQAYDVAAASIRANASGAVLIVPIKLRTLELQGLLRRPHERAQKGRAMLISQNGSARRVVTAAQRGQLWDTISGAPMSTEFAISRFLTPLLAQDGIAIFMDSDVVAHGDVYELEAIAQAQPHIAIWCVQHGRLEETGLKMDGQIQTTYSRKNWSSVMVFNCDHPATLALTLEMVNKLPGRDLHAFTWLNDSLLGRLPPEWNWLVGVQPRPAQPKIAHYTLGGPWLANWEQQEHDDEWLSAAARFRT